MARKAIHAAGGIVVRGGKRPLLAVVQRSKDERWVLPRGKLKRDENPLAGARREAVEETGHRVKVHEFLGAIAYTARGQPKLMQFWRMQAAVRPSRDVSKDIAAVEWLPLAAAVRRLSCALERLFLLNVGRRMLRRRRRGTGHKARAAKTKAARRRPRRRSSKKRTHRSLHRKPRSAAHKPAAHHATAPARRSMLARMLGRLRR
ncbi:MAG: NUDIX domain-containing protein [Rhizobiales bacterium]|nr:NUDIX domain-containing protein [Hyphomicrobiales bacterium]